MSVNENSSSKYAPPTTLVRVLAACVLLCVGGGLVALVAGASAQMVSVALLSGVAIAAGAAIYEHRRTPGGIFRARSPFEGDLIPAALPASGATWIGVDVTSAKRAKLMVWMTYSVPLLLLLPWIWVRHDLAAAPGQDVRMQAMIRLIDGVMGFMVVLFTVIALFMGWWVKRTLRSRIGVDRTHLLFDAGSGEVERYAWSSVLTDKFQLLIGRRVIPLARPAFPVEDLRGLILARLPPTSFIGHARFQWTAIRRGNVSLWAMIAALGLMGVFQLSRALYPAGFRAAGLALLEAIGIPVK